MKIVTHTLLLFVALTLTTPTRAQLPVYKPNTCGTFRIRGEIKMTDGKPALFVFTASISEIRINLLEPSRFSELPAYDGQSVEVEGLLERPIELQRGILKVRTVKLGVPDPLDPFLGHGFELIKSMRCRK